MAQQDEHEVEKLDIRSLNIADGRIRRLLEIFPEAHTEGGKVDLDKIKLAIGQSIDEGKERFGMTWPGKAACFKTIQQQSIGTLLPAPEESVNFDTTENVIIEGDNLEVLKLLQKSYLGKVKMIYIDPPYNTGNDFIYPDNYSESLDTYLEYTGQIDEDGNRFSTNTDTDGRFHSKWMNMMYPRLYLSRNLLSEDGFVFISINDVELSKLTALCNEIFGEENFIACLIWMKGKEGGNDNQGFGMHHEYIICYGKLAVAASLTISLDDKDISRHVRELPEKNLVKKGTEIYRSGEPFQLINLSKQKDYKVKVPLKSGVSIEWDSYCPQKTIDEYVRIGKLFVGARGVPYVKSFLADEKSGTKPSTLVESKYGTTKAGGISLRELFGDGKIFSYPKPPSLVSRLVEISCSSDTEESHIVIDFFAGSGTTGHAVMAQNAKDGGNRKFMLVQLPETVAKDSEAAKAGFETIADITKERVRRAGKKIVKESEGKLKLKDGKGLDVGFRLFKLDRSNFAVWDADASKGDVDKLTAQLDLQVQHVAPERSGDDVLFEVLLKSGYVLTTPVELAKVGKGEVWRVAGGELVICVDNGIDLAGIRVIAAGKPRRVVMLDRCFAGDDSLKANASKIFESAGVEDFRTI